MPPDATLLDALIRAGHPVTCGCREDVRRRCELTVLDGDPEHRDDMGAPAGRVPYGAGRYGVVKAVRRRGGAALRPGHGVGRSAALPERGDGISDGCLPAG
ncbi:oxidoreductase (plasmid) [Streptantibioticus cattleyicolor NRRL 8057 = DSM 46488]|uniref:Oxidoreductase n=1 Tax=Streptantibioticus cattleyicolor (strain ATCC 35852 / DSM 46488 / JCM 4925 / NBRC 14057 / NRRL 8057) TaxID=1003195 RepID=G8XGJ4_STREN|nr:oxidoreductase [Streptantibioticus cattleyicolor NRRL 8057 = DSM 46488]